MLSRITLLSVALVLPLSASAHREPWDGPAYIDCRFLDGTLIAHEIPPTSMTLPAKRHARILKGRSDPATQGIGATGFEGENWTMLPRHLYAIETRFVSNVGEVLALDHETNRPKLAGTYMSSLTHTFSGKSFTWIGTCEVR